jgi:hypothetical protein
MDPDDFYNMLPREFWNKVDGFYELENMREKGNWERTRWSTCLLLNIQMPKNKSIKPTDLIEFDWDEKKNIDIDKLKERAEYFKNLDKHKKMKNGK